MTPLPATAALIVEYRFDGNALDSSGNAQNGTLNGNATFVASPFGQAISLDGSGDYVHVNIANFALSQFTMEAWINVASYDSNVHYVSLYQNAYLVLGDYNSGPISSWADGLNPIDASDSFSEPTPTASAWHHFAFTYDGAFQRFFQDGIEVGTVATTGAVTLNPGLFDSGMNIGARYTADTQFVNGQMDNVRIYDQALPASALGWSIDQEICGNYAIELGEECDDGNATSGDCCSSTCQYETMGSPCDDTLFCTASGSCDATGTCNVTPLSCTDSNACTIDACDEGSNACVNSEIPRDPMLCFAPSTSKIQIKNSESVGKDKLSWQWGKGEAFAQSDLGTPDVALGTTYTLCVYDKTAGVASLAASIDIAPSTTLWSSQDPKGFRYKDKTGTSEGVTKAQMKTGMATKTKVKLAAGTAALLLPAPVGADFFNQGPDVVVQLISNAGKCWTSAFAPGDTSDNEADSFKAQVK